MKKSMGSLLLIPILVFTSHILADTTHTFDSLKTTNSKDKISDLVCSFNNKKVTYDNGKVIIMADPSKFMMSVLGIGAIGGLGLAGVTGLLGFIKIKESNKYEAGKLFVYTALLAALGGYSTYRLWPHAEKFLTKTPYITLDDTGVFEWGKLMLTWDDFEYFEYCTPCINGSIISELHLMKKDKTSAFQISDQVEYDFLPIQQGQFISLAIEVMNKRRASLYMKTAEQGDATAQLNLGICYESARGVEKDLNKAADLYKTTAQKGLAEAACRLGMCYEAGMGLEKDFKKAFYWYTKSAEQNFAKAQFLLGVCYENGQGVDKNLQQAVYWYTKAAEQNGKDDGIMLAQHNLGLCYKLGKGVEKNPEQAKYWDTKANEQGFAERLERLELEAANN